MKRETGRVLLLLSQTFADGGIQRFNRTLVAASAMATPCVDVLTLRDAPGDVPPIIGGIGAATGFGNDRVRFAMATWRALLSGRYRLLVVGHVNLLIAAWALSRFALRRPRVWMIAHGVEVWNRITPARAAAIRRLDRSLSVSTYTRGSILQQVPRLAATRAVVFPNALGASWTRRDARPTDPRVELPARFFLAVGRLEIHDRTKGIITTIEALASTQDEALQLVVAGSGADLPFLRDVAARAGVTQRVVFLGRVSDAVLQDLYGRCLAFVLPSSQEGFGIVYLEAAYFGAPVLGAREKGVIDVIEDGETGLLVEYGDRVALTRALDRLAADETLRARLRSRARAQVTGTGHFTFAAYRSRWRALLDDAGVSLSEAIDT